MKHLIDIIFQAFAIILRNDLNSSHVHFEQKKLLLHFTIHDAYLVKSFYDLNPTEKQIHLVQQIWRTKLNSCERLLQKLIAYIEENLNSSLTLQLEYFQHKPNEYQKQLMKQICQSKYEQETSEQEYEFLKEQIAYYNLPSQSFESLTIPHHPFIDSIQNLTIREALVKQFKEVAIQSRIALFNMYLKSAEDQRDEYKKKHEVNIKKHEVNIKKMGASQDALNNNEKLSSTFVQLINERCNKISESIQYIYKHKRESFQSKSN
ncbi:unnamed protein product [Rotaria magnacalcarata]|uniref:Uncharacterized protein n=1 Tax=Rotaria magnacalcarata TaxID=392030 RepID=A0A8S3E154_9BILA|nr:unnamed protein product [Rotaria magnacalcarata]